MAPATRMTRLAALLTALTLGGCDSKPFAKPVDLFKVYKREAVLPAGSTFRVAVVDGIEICQEIADLYNAKSSVVEAGVLQFYCRPQD